MYMSVAPTPLTMRIELAGPHHIDAVLAVFGDQNVPVTTQRAVGATGSPIAVELSCNVTDYLQSERLRSALIELDGVHILDVGDRTFLLHDMGMIAVTPTVPLENLDDLSMAYTPGVARISTAIAEDPGKADTLTIKRNTVAVVTDGSAVLGLGNIGPLAALPVMEGKALLFKRLGGVDAWPVCLATQDPDEIVRVVECLAPVYGGINLEDISAPRCFEIERRLRASLDIPVFHDDQHGTAIVVFAALTNALRVVGKSMSDVRVVVLGTGAAGVAIIKLLLAEGVGDVIGVNRGGILSEGRGDLDDERRWVAANSNASNRFGDLAAAVAGADVLIGVSGPNLISEEDLESLAPDSIVFALANPDPEVDPALARRHAAIVATGRSGEPNQINNVLVFPGLFRGLLDVGATQVTEAMSIEVGRALADVVPKQDLSPELIIPTVFDPGVVPAVSSAVQRTVVQSRHGA